MPGLADAIGDTISPILGVFNPWGRAQWVRLLPPDLN